MSRSRLAAARTCGTFSPAMNRLAKSVALSRAALATAAPAADRQKRRREQRFLRARGMSTMERSQGRTAAELYRSGYLRRGHSIDRTIAMPSPFPGMDPYLEHRDYFPGFHADMITYLK